MTKQPSVKKYTKNDVIIKQGDEGNSAFVIDKGRVEILIEKDRGLIQSLGTRGEGAIIGEMSLIDNEPRTATVKAIEDCALLEITRNDFDRRLKSSDPIVNAVTRIILTRYRDIINKAHILGNSSGYPAPEEIEKKYTDENRALDTLKFGHEFKSAIKQGHIYLNYQPIIDIQNSDIIGFEALMRWNHPEKGFISPEIFIPLAEQNNVMTEATYWALSESCQALKRAEEKIQKNGKLFVSVNYSSNDIVDKNFNENIEKQLTKNNLKPDQLHIEITERSLIEESTLAKDKLQKCKESGVGISIDDFGTGYSSLSYLHYFPINILKIDRSFIKNMEEDPVSFELVKTIINLGKNMNMKIIAEGIEELSQQKLLKELGCDAGQGYHIAKPMAEEDLINFLLK
jgi:EAL domain-containing protein (putative c-di-GMP-specific phosphodiesterase class I)